jgi:DNA excision repair protein ERCC-8
LISLGKDNQVRLWNTFTGQNTLVNYGKVNFGSVFQDICIQLSMTDFNGNNFVFVPNGRSLNMYNIFDGTQTNVFKGHFDAINCCLYHPLLNEIYTGSNDRNLLIWSPEISNDALEDVESDKASLKRPFESNTFYQSKRKKEALEQASTSAGQDQTNNAEAQQDLQQDNWSDED